MTASDRPVLLLGATGTIGRATHRALHAAGHRVIAPVRAQAGRALPPDGVEMDLTEQGLTALIQDTGCTAVISCIASRTGAPADAWAIDHGLNSRALGAAIAAGVRQYVLLSAICVQKPLLGFQEAKLAFEAELRGAPLVWSIVRPTAFFKSLSGQVDRLRAGKPFLIFGDGSLTACKPIADADLAEFLVGCLSDPARQRRILPIGGPGPALTAREQGALLFEALELEPTYRSVPVGLLSAIIGGLSAVGKLSSRAAEKAELARIGRYYATESMLVWDAEAGRYDADATPEFGTITLADHYARLARGEVADDRGEHAVF